ncbi:MAG TPA: hypothetical protein PKO06_20390, partial [Candidatus Ozemobacteraceae bacterium]|nr:hypothetical protein [Candidatus Ozemobacteraceae bacterium]
TYLRTFSDHAAVNAVSGFDTTNLPFFRQDAEVVLAFFTIFFIAGTRTSAVPYYRISPSKPSGRRRYS